MLHDVEWSTATVAVLEPIGGGPLSDPARRLRQVARGSEPPNARVILGAFAVYGDRQARGAGPRDGSVRWWQVACRDPRCVRPPMVKG